MKAENQNSSSEEPNMEKLPPNRIPNPIVARLKKIGFSVWLTVMIIGGALAFLTALLLL